MIPIKMSDGRKRNLAAGYLLIAVIVIAVTFIVKPVMSQEYSYKAILKCDSCRYLFEKKLTTRLKPPIKCPKCGKTSAYRAIKCLKCNEIFTLKPLSAADKDKPDTSRPIPMPEVPKCPKCGSTALDVMTQL